MPIYDQERINQIQKSKERTIKEISEKVMQEKQIKQEIEEQILREKVSFKTHSLVRKSTEDTSKRIRA